MSDFFVFLRDLRVDIEPGTAFVAMPFSNELRSRHTDVIVPALREEGIVAWRADDVYTTASIMENIVQLLQRAELVIADLTGRNPNVLYELGLASAWGKKVILLSTGVDDIPVDLRHLVHVTLGGLSTELQKAAVRQAVVDVRREDRSTVAHSAAQRILATCEILGIFDSLPVAQEDFIFRTMIGARRSVSAVGLTGRSIFSTDAVNLKRIREHLANVDVRVYLPHPDFAGAQYADKIEKTIRGAAAAQIRLSSLRFASLGFPVYWVRIPTPVGGAIVDSEKGIFQFFSSNQWNTPFVEVIEKAGGMFEALQAIFQLYIDSSQPAEVL